MAVQMEALWIFVGICLHKCQPFDKMDGKIAMNKHCGSSYEVDKHLTVHLTRPLTLPVQCGLDLRTDEDKLFRVNIVHYNISSQIPCRNYLQIFDGLSTDVKRTAMTRLCDNGSIPSRHWGGRYVSLFFHSDTSGENSSFEVNIGTSFIDYVDPDPENSAVYIIIAVITSFLLLMVIIGMCCCVYMNRKKEIRRRRRRNRQRQNTIQMTLEFADGLDNPCGPPLPPPNLTPPAYSPPSEPPPYSTLPRRHLPSVSEDITSQEKTNKEEITPQLPEAPPPYDETVIC